MVLSGYAVEYLNVQAGLVQPHLVFAFRDTNRDTLVFLHPEIRDVAARVQVQGTRDFKV